MKCPSRLLGCHIYPYIGRRRVAEISREAIHRLLTAVLPGEGASQSTVTNTRTCLSAMLQTAWDHGYRSDNPVKGIGLPLLASSADRTIAKPTEVGHFRS